jgi:hypothetical protein
LDLQIVAESGRSVAVISLAAAEGFWTWDLKDAGGRFVPPGVYYFRSAGQPARSLLLLP